MAGIEPANLSSRGEYDNHWTTGVDNLEIDPTGDQTRVRCVGGNGIIPRPQQWSKQINYRLTQVINL